MITGRPMFIKAEGSGLLYCFIGPSQAFVPPLAGTSAKHMYETYVWGYWQEVSEQYPCLENF